MVAPSSNKDGGNEEQERLIQGYQKVATFLHKWLFTSLQENERLYSELVAAQRDMKAERTQLLEDNNKIAMELANLRSTLILVTLAPNN